MTQPSINERLSAGVRKILEQAAHTGIAYRATKDIVDWTPVVKATFHPDRPELLGFSENEKADMMPNTATLKICDDQPVLSANGQVQAKGWTWAILGVSRHNGKYLYKCKRGVPAPGRQAGPNRGGGR